MPSTPRTPAPERPPPPVPPPPIEPPPPDPSPSPPGEEYHTPTPSLGEASPREPSPRDEDGSANDGTAIAKSPPLSPVRFPSPHRLPPPSSPSANNGQEAATPSPARHARQQLRLATGRVRTPSQGSTEAKSPSPSPPSPLTPAPAAKSLSPSPPSPLTPAPTAKSPSPPSPLTPAPAAKSPPSPLTPAPAAKSSSPSPPSPLTPAPAVNRSKSGQGTPKRAEAWKSPPPPPIAPAAVAAQFDPAEEALTSPLRIGKPRLDQQRRTPASAENGGAATVEVPPEVAAVAKVGERRALSVALRLATAVLSLASFSVMVSARTSGWAGDYYGRHEQYRYAVGVNVIVCVYSIAQCFGEIRRLISPGIMFRSPSRYYFSLFLDQALAYLLMSASSAAASRNDLWVSRFGTDPFNKKINSAVWLSFIAFLTLAANALISTANLFSMV